MNSTARTKTTQTITTSKTTAKAWTLLAAGALAVSGGLVAAPGAASASATPHHAEQSAATESAAPTEEVAQAASSADAAQAFRDKWEGSYIDVDGYYGAQCWDLVAQYAIDNGLPALATGDGAAAGIFENYDTNGNAQYWEKHVNSTTDPDSVPKAGDVLVWDRSWGGGYGHTAVVLEADWNNVTVLEQNPGAANVSTYDYSGVMGWLSMK